MLKVFRRHHKAFLIGASILIIPALAFWGGASRMSGRGPGEGEVAKVNGAAITEQDMIRAAARMRDNFRQRMGANYDPDLIGSGAMMQGALNELINAKLFLQESRRLRTRVTQQDIEDYLKSVFQADSEEGAKNYNDYISRDDIRWSKVYQDLKAQIRLARLFADVESGAKLSESEIRNEYILRNEEVKVRYAVLNPSQFESEVAVTEEMLKDYYDMNSANYIEPAKVKVKYVEARVEPSESDREAVLEKAGNVLAKAQAGEDFAELAKRYSEAPDAAENGGDMDWVEQSFLTGEVATAVGELEAGQLTGVVETQQGVHIYKCEDIKEEDGKKKIKLRQIEFALAASAETRDKIASEVDALSEKATSSKSLEVAAEELGMEVKESLPFSKTDRFIQGVRPEAARSFVSAAFALDNPGDLSYEVRTPETYYLLELIEHQESRLRELSEVEAMVRNGVVRQEALVLANKRAAEIASQISSLGDLDGVDEALASSLKVSPPFTRRGYVPGVAGDREFYNVAFASELGELSGPILGRNGVYFLEVVEKVPIDEDKYVQEKDKLKETLLAQRKQMLSADWLRWLRARADIRINAELLAEFMSS